MKPFTPDNFLILVVDDISTNLQIVGALLDQVGYATTFAMSGKQALERLKEVKPDLILLDLMMPEIDGLEVCQRLKKNANYKDIPIIFLTASDEQKHLLKAFELGAVDYVTKPFNARELMARVRTHLELKYTRDQLKQTLTELEQALSEVEILAKTDELTGIPNRRYLFSFAEKELSRVRRYHYDFSVLMLDIDHFKRINDTYGHAVGDEALKLMTQTVLKIIRQEDCFGRLGGEEFLLLLPQTNITSAQEIAERLRVAIAETFLWVEEKAVEITISIGVAGYQSRNDTIDTLLKRADDALFQAKNNGRNQVIVKELYEVLRLREFLCDR